MRGREGASCRRGKRRPGKPAQGAAPPALNLIIRTSAARADGQPILTIAETTAPITPQHYAFLVGGEEFDAAFGRIRDQDLPYWADPGQRRPGVINHRDGGRGLYFEDSDAHLMEIITRPYSSGG